MRDIRFVLRSKSASDGSRLVSPAAAFIYAGGWMALALVGLLIVDRDERSARGAVTDTAT